MDKNRYSVIIVGAGPAGLSCALNLLENGITDVLVLERYTFPRSKCCAGYITAKTKTAYKKLGLCPGECHYSLIEDFKIFHKLSERYRIKNKFLYTNANIDRVELDNAFFLAAKERGVNIRENANVTDHNLCDNSVTINGSETVFYDTLVFADGTAGVSSRYQPSRKRNIAMQLIFDSDLEDGIAIHFGITQKGYGWVSTLGGKTNIGLTDVFDPKVNYRLWFSNFLELLNIKADIRHLKAAFTPIGVRKPIINGNVYHVGDALGACDPLTLSGLRYGLRSGEEAASAISESRPAAFIRYANGLRIKFFIMKILQDLFYLRPVQFLVFNVGCKYFGGVISFFFNNFFVNKK